MATYTAQENLKQFEEVSILSETPLTWSSTKIQTVIKNWFELKRLARVEINDNKAEAEQQQIADTATRRHQAITYLTNHGFACDNSLTDWQKLYNHPAIFGANWNTQAVYQKGIADDKEAEKAGEGLNYFLMTAYQLWQEYVNNR